MLAHHMMKPVLIMPLFFCLLNEDEKELFIQSHLDFCKYFHNCKIPGPEYSFEILRSVFHHQSTQSFALTVATLLYQWCLNMLSYLFWVTSSSILTFTGGCWKWKKYWGKSIKDLCKTPYCSIFITIQFDLSSHYMRKGCNGEEVNKK